MKKALFIILALASVAIGCTKSEVVKAPGRGREIKFDTYVGKTPMTKAESADLAYVRRELAAGGGFQVYAFLHNYIEPTTQTPAEGDEIFNGSDTYVDPTNVGVSTAYMDKIVTWVGETPDNTDTPDVNEFKAGYWDYDGVVYWPDHTTSRKLAFAAYGLNVKDNIVWDNDPTVSGNEKTKHPEGQSYTKFTYTVPSAVADQKDLLVAPFLPNQGLSENQDAKPVSINFKHLLSRVGFQVVANQTTDDVQIKIQEIKLVGNFPTTGKVDLKGTGVITPNTADTDPFQPEYTFFPGDEYFITTSNEVPTDIFANKIYVDDPEGTAGEDGTLPKVEAANSDASNRYMMIMPSQQAKHMIYNEDGTPALDADGNVTYVDGQTLPGAYIEVNYQLTDADPQKARVSLDNWTFAAGKSYVFVFKVSTYSIQFDVTVDNWNEHFSPVTEGTKPGESNGYFTLTPIVGDNN